jgi:outer membrane protein assembly factor BamB
LNLVLVLPGLAFIERLTPLQNLIGDADFIVMAKVSSLDRDKPSLVLTVGDDLKGKPTFTRMPVNLVGDKEKHTPQLLERLERDLPVVVFVTSLDSRQLGLAYSNGTWFQIIGQSAPGDATTRWSFTHCEIYLRRTFIGSTEEMRQIVTDVVASKRKAPPPNPKEKPGFGPPVKRAENGERKVSGRVEGREWRMEDRDWPKHLRPVPLITHHSPLITPAVAVVGLPVLMPIVALLQLLFPGLLRDQWRQYRVAVQVLLTQSTLMAAHWIVMRWFIKERTWWLSDQALTLAVFGVAGLGAVWASVLWVSAQTPRDQRCVRTPVPVEYFALSMLLVAGLGWAAYLWLTGSFPIDQMAVVSLAAVAAIGHLILRRIRCGVAGTRPAWFTTEHVFLWCLTIAGFGVTGFLNAREANRIAKLVATDWPTFRGIAARLGAASPDDAGLASKPDVLWIFDPRERKGRVHFHSSPTVVDGQLYIGALHEVSTLSEGYVYCVNARYDANRPLESETPVRAGDLLWRFNAGGTLKPVFSSPSVADGRVFIGEGYHQDAACRLFCLDATSGDRVAWSFATQSHVESSPTIAGDAVFLGAGDDGLFCVAAAAAGGGEPPAPDVRWHVENIHVDASPAVADGRVIVGTAVGDVHRETLVLALDAATGRELWRSPTPLPVPASPAIEGDRVFVGLGNGKVDYDADDPAGSVWCLDAASGSKRWEFRTTKAVLATPAVSGGRVFVGSRDERCYCLNANTGEAVWSVSAGAPIVASPVVAGGHVCIVTTTGIVLCLDAVTGVETWRFEIDVPNADLFASSVLVGGRLYVAAGGKVYCLGSRE